MMPITIYKNKKENLKIQVQTTAPQAVIALLNQMVWGTSGPRYTKRGIEDKVEKLIKPCFFLLKKVEAVIGICALSERQILLGQEWRTSYYIRHFCIHPDYQGHGYSKLLIEQLKDYFTADLPKPYVAYAFIEGRNIRSNKVAQFMDAPLVRMFDSVLFSRLFPTKNGAVRLAKPEEYPLIEAKLKTFYADYNFVHFTKTFYKDQYYVYEENGEIVAGVQAHQIAWRIHQLGSAWSDKILLKALPNLPLVNRLFHPEYNSLALSSIFYEGDRKERLLSLFESVLVHRSVYTALLMLDQECRVYADLNSLDQWGLLQKIQKPVSAGVILKNYGFSADELGAVSEKPAYIASFDCL